MLCFYIFCLFILFIDIKNVSLSRLKQKKLSNAMKRNLLHRYLSAKVLPIWTILLIDVVIIAISGLLAYAFRYDFGSIFHEDTHLDNTILWTIVVNLVFFRVFKTYSNVLRFSSLLILCVYLFRYQ